MKTEENSPFPFSFFFPFPSLFLLPKDKLVATSGGATGGLGGGGGKYPLLF